MNGTELILKEKADLFRAIEQLELQRKMIDEQEKAMKEELLQAFEDYGLFGLEVGRLSMTYIAKTTRDTIDSKRLKAEMPDVAKFYTKTSPVSASIRIKVKDGSEGKAS